MTKMANPKEIKREWVVINAEGRTFGRLITEIATILRGKNKPYFTPYIDCGDYVVITNAKKVKFSSAKADTKNYYRHTGYFGGVKSEKLADLLKSNPKKLFRLATRGMLPKNKLGKEMLKKLKVYEGAEHPHTAQIKNSQGNR